MEEKHTIGLLVQDHPGVLQRICGLFGRRGFNIEGLTVGASERQGLSRMILVLKGGERDQEQLCKQLSKLIDVVSVELLSRSPIIVRELMLVKLNVDAGRRAEVLGIVDTFRCSVADVGPETLTIQVVGDADKNRALLQLLVPYGIRELVRTGETAIRRGVD